MGKLSAKTLALVIAAIKNMRESKGSSSRDILNYITSVYDIPQDVAKRQMVAALKRGVAHGILKRSDGYFSLPTDTEAECMEVAAQELGLLDLCCRKKKRESRRKKGCKSVSSRRKKRASRKGKSRKRGCKSRSGRSRSKKRRSKKRGKSSRGCGCKSKRGKRSKHSRRGKSRGCKPKRRSKRSKRMKCGEEDEKPKGKQCDTLNIDVYDNEEREFTDRHNGRCRSKSRSRSCSRNRNVVPTA